MRVGVHTEQPLHRHKIQSEQYIVVVRVGSFTRDIERRLTLLVSSDRLPGNRCCFVASDRAVESIESCQVHRFSGKVPFNYPPGVYPVMLRARIDFGNDVDMTVIVVGPKSDSLIPYFLLNISLWL